MASLEESSRNVGEKTSTEAQRRSSDIEKFAAIGGYDSLQEIHEDFMRIFAINFSKLPKPRESSRRYLNKSRNDPLLWFTLTLSLLEYCKKEVADDVQLSDEINLTGIPVVLTTGCSGINNEERERLF